ncbi:MAG: MFS transporter [Sphingomonadaceae bacterium]
MGETAKSGAGPDTGPDAAAEWRHGWTLVIAAMAGYSLASVHAGSAGVMLEPIEHDLKWSRTQIYSGVSLVSLVSMVLATFMGVAIDRFGARRIALGTSSIFLVALALMSTTGDNLWGWWLRWMLVGVGVSAMPTVWITAVAGQFDKARGLAVAVALSGSGIGTFLSPILINIFVESHGWRGAYIGLALAWGIVVLPLVFLFFRTDRASSGTTQATRKPLATDLPGLTRQEGFRSLTFWKLLFAGAGATLGGVAIILNMVPVLTSDGVSRASAAAIAGLVGISTIVGRIAGGWLMDRFSAKWIAFGATISAVTLPLALLGFPGSATIAAIGVVIYGLMGGAKVGALVYLASRHLGQRAFGALYGAINAAIALVVAAAPLAANYVYDVTKSYELVMWAALPILIGSALLYATLGRYPDFTQDAKQASS